MIKSSKLISIFLAVVILILLWWFSLTNIERWLFINKGVVEEHLLSRMNGKALSTPDVLIDTVICKEKNLTTISFHDNHSTILAFATNLQARKQVKQQFSNYDIKKINKNWYEITITSSVSPDMELRPKK